MVGAQKKARQWTESGEIGAEKISRIEGWRLEVDILKDGKDAQKKKKN
jgi:hypothetical protein